MTIEQIKESPSKLYITMKLAGIEGNELNVLNFNIHIWELVYRQDALVSLCLSFRLSPLMPETGCKAVLISESLVFRTTLSWVQSFV